MAPHEPAASIRIDFQDYDSQVNLEWEHADDADDAIRERAGRVWEAVREALDEEDELGVVGGSESSETWSDTVPQA